VKLVQHTAPPSPPQEPPQQSEQPPPPPPPLAQQQLKQQPTPLKLCSEMERATSAKGPEASSPCSSTISSSAVSSSKLPMAAPRPRHSSSETRSQASNDPDSAVRTALPTRCDIHPKVLANVRYQVRKDFGDADSVNIDPKRKLSEMFRRAAQGSDLSESEVETIIKQCGRITKDRLNSGVQSGGLSDKELCALLMYRMDLAFPRGLKEVRSDLMDQIAISLAQDTADAMEDFLHYLVQGLEKLPSVEACAYARVSPQAAKLLHNSEFGQDQPVTFHSFLNLVSTPEAAQPGQEAGGALIRCKVKSGRSLELIHPGSKVVIVPPSKTFKVVASLHEDAFLGCPVLDIEEMDSSDEDSDEI